VTNATAKRDTCPTWDTEIIRNGDIELRFKLRDKVSEELANSIGEHGVLNPPIVLELTPELQKFFQTKKRYLCIDGHSRLQEIPNDMELECLIVKWDELVRQSQRAFQKAGMQASKIAPDEVFLTFILRLHACREPLPRSAYVDAAEKLLAMNLSIRQVAALLGVPKTSLHRWMRKEDVTDSDLEASMPSTQVKKQCGLCGNWIRGGARPIWFHPNCHDKVVVLIEKTKCEKDANQGKGGENDG
jgi:hypothetical protein